MVQEQMVIAEKLLQALGEPVLLLDGELRAVMANPAFYHVLQVPHGRLKGKSIHEFMSGENETLHLLKVLAPVAEYHGEVEGVEVECSLPDRGQIILSVSARRLTGAQEGAGMILVELRDVTWERNAERRIQELNHALERHITKLGLANEELEAFSHSISHDLRMPLRLMNKVSHTLLRRHGANLPDGAADIVQMIISSTKDMEKLIEALLMFSQLIRTPLKQQRVGMKRLAREVVGEMRGELNGRTVEFEVGDVPDCQADRTLLKEVFLNLVGNALKFTRSRDKARIQIGALIAGSETVYFVRDNGVGFDNDKADTLFTAFHRLHKPGEYEGSGIGLALSRRIVERHNGRIWCEGETDKGATFYFTLGKNPARQGTTNTEDPDFDKNREKNPGR